MASAYLSKTFGQAGNRRTFTVSYWIKTNGLTSTNPGIFDAGADGSNSDDLYIHTGRLNFSGYYGSTQYQVRANAKDRDPHGWYHHVIRFDTTQSTASDRLRLYINGELVTSLANNTYPSQDFQTTYMNTARLHTIGSFATGSLPNTPLDGQLAHFHFTDGYSYDASTFGLTDPTTGEWKPKTAPSVNYGTNGFFLKFDNSANMGLDSSGQGNNWTTNGTIIQNKDTPSNVFACLNPLANCNTSGVSLSNTNSTITTPSGGHDFSVSSLGMFSGNGKFYCEIKISSGTNFNIVGISDHIYQGSNQEISEDNYSYGYYSDSGGSSTGGVVRGNGSNVLTGMPNYTTNDIIGIAVDLENHKLYFSKNGTWINSGDPTSGSTGTGAVSINNLNTTPNTDARAQGAYFFGCGDWYTSGGGTYQCNFGNGYFGTTAVASAGTNASNNGIFEYDVPTGYTALSTKGLNL